MFRSIRCFVLAMALIGLAGCANKIKFESAFEVTKAEIKFFFVDSPKENQSVRVEVISDVPVNVFVMMSEEVKKAGDEAILAGPSNAIASKYREKNITLDAVIPSKAEFAVCIVSPSGKATGTIKMNSQ